MPIFAFPPRLRFGASVLCLVLSGALADQCDVGDGTVTGLPAKKTSALLQVRKPSLDAMQPEVLQLPPFDAKEDTPSIRGPLFEQCRSRRASGDRPQLNASEIGHSKANVSLLASAADSTSCSLEEISLVVFQSNGQATLECCPASNLACSGCEAMTRRRRRSSRRRGYGDCQVCAGGFQFGQTAGQTSCVACRDIPGFSDPTGKSCQHYWTQSVCRNGVVDTARFNSKIVQGTTIEHYQHNGLSAKEACCACGGGMQASTPFRYTAAGRSYVLGEPMADSPYPRTAASYRVAGVLDGSACNLHSLGLSLDPITGRISGTPTAEEPTEVECTIEAVQDESLNLVANTTVKIDLQYFAYDAQVLSFPTSSISYMPRKPSGVSYERWRLDCTPETPWLRIVGRTGELMLRSSSGTLPEAAFCTITANNGTADHSLSLAVVYPNHWASMELKQIVGEKKVSVGSVLNLIAGRAIPALTLAADDSATPPIAFYASCSASGLDVKFDLTTGDIVVDGHVAFRLDLPTGEILGIPDMGVLGSCNENARCSISLTCTFFGEFGFQPLGSLPQFLKLSAEVVIRDDTCWQTVSSSWKELYELTGSGSCRSRCRSSSGCSAYQSRGSGSSKKCFAVRRMSAAACPKICTGCGPGTCTNYCTQGQCVTPPDWTQSVDCTGCGTPDFTTAFVRINDCDALSSCLSLTKLGNAAAFLEGDYCPAADGEHDGVLPYYAKTGEVPAATLYLAKWMPARELSDPCPSGTAWVIRRSDVADFFKGDYLELRGEVLACIAQAELGATVDSSSWSIGDSVLDEISSEMSVKILDAGYKAKHPSESSSKVLISPAARVCPNPLDEREGQKTKGDDDNGDGFEFDDPDNPIGGRHFYALSPCECFGGHYGAAAPVSDSTFSSMPPGSDNKFIPASSMVVSGSLSCEPQKLLKTLVEVGAEGCDMACRSGDHSSGGADCDFYFTGSYTDMTVCRLYSGCGSLVHEVNSHGELYAVTKEEACLVADPEACKAHKREKWLAGELDPVGDCLYEDLLSQCDASLIHGGHGISECGSCTHMRNSAKAVGLSKLKRPLPESFLPGSLLTVSCGARFAGLNRFGNDPLSSQEIMCQDGAWVDPGGGPGLIALQCVACARATPRSGSSLREFMAGAQQEKWWLQRHPVEIRSWDNLCLTSDSASDSSVTISFVDPVDVPASVASPRRRDSAIRRRNVDSGENYGSVAWGGSDKYLYGWTGDGGHCAFDQRNEVAGSFALSWSQQGDHQRIEDVPGFLAGVQYTVSFKAKAIPSMSSVSVYWASTSGSCEGSACPSRRSCPSGTTLTRCDAVTEVVPANKDPLGVQVTSGGECRAYSGTGLGANVRVGDEKIKAESTGSTGTWSDYAGCGASGYFAVTPARMWAGTNFAGDGRRRRNIGYDLNRISNHNNDEKTRLCPEGTWLKRMEVCAGNKWDGVYYGQCTDNTHMDTQNDACGRRRRRGGRRRNDEGRRRQTQMNTGTGARRVWGRAGSNADKVCIDGGNCAGSTNSNPFDMTCGSDGLLAGFKEYHRRRSIRFMCREVRPVVKAFDCNENGCRAICANDECKIRPFCVKGGSSTVRSGGQTQSVGGGQWSGWSTCPSGYLAVGLRYMEMIGSVVDGDVSSLDDVQCESNKCRAKSTRKAVKIKSACIRHASVTMGTNRERTGTGWSSVSSCPSGYNPIGVAKASMVAGWDTMRIWECDTSGCKIYCVGTGKCSLQTACISAKTLARAECATWHRNLIVRTSTGTGTRTPSNCPSTHYSARCLCWSSTQDKCAYSRRRNVGPSGCSVNFGSSTGRVTRLCTQATGSMRAYLGDEASHIYTDLTANYVTRSHTFTAEGSGKLPLRVRGLAPSQVTLYVTDLTVTDAVSDVADQSLLIDLENKCSGSRWEIQLPASPQGTPYQVTINYGDQRTAIQTSHCTIGTAGQMISARASPETVPKGSTKSVKRTVFVSGGSDGRGKLVFAGESAGGCTGINSLSVAREDSVFWSSCGAPFSQVWNLAASKQAPGNIQLVHRARLAGSSSAACVDPATGKMVTCEDSVEAHVKQVFSLDYLAPLVAKWTQFESGDNLQSGSCVRAHAKYLPNLDINENLVSCGDGQVLSSFLFRQDSSCNHEHFYRYFYSCTTIIPVTGTASCSQKSTRCVAHSKSDPHIWELDRHDVGAHCEAGTLLTKFAYTDCTDDEGSHGYKYTYTCCPAQGLGECQEINTEWGEVGSLSDLTALQHHQLQCPSDSGLKRFLLEAQVPEVAEGETLQGEVRYTFVCCKLPLAPPVSVRTGPLVAQEASAWEGTYCPNGRVEGRPDFRKRSGSFPQYTIQPSVTCGWGGSCSGNNLHIDNGERTSPAAAAHVGTICGPICSANEECGGFMYAHDTSPPSCYYRKNTTCHVEAAEDRECWHKVEGNSMTLGFDRLAGTWCLSPAGENSLCSSVADVGHPSELSGESMVSVDYTPLVPMETDFEGNGAVDVDRDVMAQSLLGTGSSTVSREGTGGGLGNKKFQKLPKIPKAKFEMAKFEMADFAPFEGERQELQSRSVTETVLNWAPEDVTYAPHCLARESREKITGAEPVEGEHFLSMEERQKDAVGACYHALGVDSSGASAAETWGEEGVPGKRNTDWQDLYVYDANPSFPGLTADAVWDCSTRDINRNYKLAMWDRDAEFKEAMVEDHAEPIAKGVCAAIPGAVTLAGAIAAYAGVKTELRAICDSIAANVRGGLLYAIATRQDYRDKRYIVSDYADCNPLQNTMAKVYCDLSCVEDAVKRGDSQILASIGTLNHNILSEMKEFFDHYVSEIFTRLTHIEDKSSHESSELKQVLDTYAKAEIDAVNSNGKQIINAMNTQHSAMNKNLGAAAKQIFDLTHEEHKVLAEKIDGVNVNIAQTSDAIDKLKEDTMKGFDDAFSEFADSLTESSLLDVNLHKSTRSALDQLSEWHKDSMHRVGNTNLQQIEQALRALKQRVASARLKGLAANQTLVEKRKAFTSLQKDANSTLHQLFRLQGASDTSAPAVVAQDMKKLLKAAQTSIRSHHLAAKRMGRRMRDMQGSDYNRSTSSAQLVTDLHIETQLVEFDKILLRIRQAAEEYLEAAHSQVGLVGRATELTEQYLSQCSSDFWELSLAARKALAAGKKAARSARMAMGQVTQEVGLLADMLVDGGLARHAAEAAARTLAEVPQGARATAADEEEVPDEALAETSHDAEIQQVVQLFQAFRPEAQESSASALLAQPELHQALSADLLSRLHGRMPPFLPKALASFRLVQDLRDRHDMHGLSRSGVQDAQLMAAAWARLDSELANLAAQMRVEDSALGAAFAARADQALEALAPVPAPCRPLLRGAGWSTWAQASRFGADSWILVRGAARLVQHKPGYHRSHHDFALKGATEALLCIAGDGAEPSVRHLEEGEVVVCFHDDAEGQQRPCTESLKLGDLGNLNFWVSPLQGA